MKEPLLTLRAVSHRYGAEGKGAFWALRNLSLDLHPKETLGIIGETGSGKSTAGMAAVGQLRPTEGEVQLRGRPLPKGLSPGRVQMVFQDPVSSLDPRLRVEDILTEPMEAAHMGTAAERRDRARSLITRVGLAEEHLSRRRGEFSGGQCQRIAIARAIATNPDFVVLDEPTSSLDVIVQAKILNLLQDIQEEEGTAYLFISHNLAVVEAMADRVLVLYRGHTVEEGDTERVLGAPAHPYTRALSGAILEVDALRSSARLREELPVRNILSAALPSLGCPYAALCPLAEEICWKKPPELKEHLGRRIACHVVVGEPAAEKPAIGQGGTA